MSYKKLKIIISGGGTGGHIFPAVSIAQKLKELNGDTEILFVGASGRMEMEKIPALGYRIIGLPIVGLQRQLSLKGLKTNLSVPFKVISSVSRAKKIISEFKPDIAIGVGGYASAPLLWAASSMGIPCLIQEQNGFAGLTNKILGKKVEKICVAYEGMERFFPAEKIVMTGNPIRSDIHPFDEKAKAEGVSFYGLNPDRKHLLIIGGSLGSRTLNNAMKVWIENGCKGAEGIDVMWQCGKYYKKGIDDFMSLHPTHDIWYSDFISRMDLAYAAADVVISRSGASSISEICVAGKAAVFVPSPNVAEDHQTHNAMALVNKKAALIVKDSEAVGKMMKTAIKLAGNPEKLESIEKNALKMGFPDAAQKIAEEVYKLV